MKNIHNFILVVIIQCSIPYRRVTVYGAMDSYVKGIY